MLPNKVISISESIIWKLPYMLDELAKEDLGVAALYEKVISKFDDINEFLLSLDVLYVLNSISFNEDYGVIQYVKGN